MSNNQQVNDEDFSQEDNQRSNGGDHHGDAGENGNVRNDDRKLFVGRLSWETTEKELREHFGQYGEIESVNVKTDPQTGRSRGFAFIVFASPEAIDKVTSVEDHVINNKKVDPKKATARQGKIFVGGLNTNISDEEIKAFFGQFGQIVGVEMPFDKQKNQRKGFCFITFDSERVVNELLKTPKQVIAGKEVDVKRAISKPDNNAPIGGGPRGYQRDRQVRVGGYGQSGGSLGNRSAYGYGYGGAQDGYSSAGYDYYGGGGIAANYGNYDYTGYAPYTGSNYSGRGQQRGGGGAQQPRHQPY